MKVKKLLIVLVILIFTGTAYAGLNSGLVAHYPFDGDIRDVSGNENHGVMHGTTVEEALIEDRFDNPDMALFFDGIDDFIQVPGDDSLDITTGEITMCAWVNIPEFLGTGQYYIIDSRDGLGGGYGINIDTNYFQFWIGSKTLNFLIEIPSKEWHFIVATYDSEIMNLYINGVLTKISYLTAEFIPSLTSLFIGQYRDYKQRFSGKMDDIRIYDRVLSEYEVKELYVIKVDPEDPPPVIVIKTEKVSAGGCFMETIGE